MPQSTLPPTTRQQEVYGIFGLIAFLKRLERRNGKLVALEVKDTNPDRIVVTYASQEALLKVKPL